MANSATHGARLTGWPTARCRPLLFPVMRRGTFNFVRTFVEKLSSVTNHPDYGPSDAEFLVRVRVDRTLVPKLELASSPPTDQTEIAPYMYFLYDALRAADEARDFRIVIAGTHNLVLD
jgi:hypothetical protein